MNHAVYAYIPGRLGNIEITGCEHICGFSHLDLSNELYGRDPYEAF